MAWVETQFEEPERVQFVKLERIGDAVEGVFVDTEQRKNNFGKEEVHIKIKTGEDQDGAPVIESMRANQRLLAQVAPVRKGALIRIEYVEDRPNDGVDREGRPLSPTKLFKVQTQSANAAPTSRASQTREDDPLPF